MDDLWKIYSTTFEKDRESIMRRGNQYQIANGYMGYRGTLDEFGADQLVGVTLAGIFDQVGQAWREPVNAPNGGYTKIRVDGNEISALHTEIIKHQQTLEMRDASFSRTTIFLSGNNHIEIKSKRILSAKNPNLMLIEYSFKANKKAEIQILTGIDFKVWDLNGPHLENIKAEARDAALLVEADTHEAGKTIAVAELTDFPENAKSVHIVRDHQNLNMITLTAESGISYTLRKYVAVVKEGDNLGLPPTDQAIEIVSQAKNKGFSACLTEHNDEWAKKWENCDVSIEGDEQAQLALRYSIFQLLMVAPCKGSGNSIPARALSGQVYKGAIFWDTEMFMFPFFLYSYPEVAAELLQYRINTLDGARRKARSEGVGYRGAFYAWESQDTGDDACTYYNVGDPTTKRDLRTHFRDKQIHISGDVAIAMWEYFNLTNDDSLLLKGGAEVILECARFFVSYAYYKADKNRYELLDVIGPDEYHERVNNNIFTNKVAEATLKVALEAVSYLRKTHPDKLKSLLSKLDIEDELSIFEEVLKKLYIPAADDKTGLIEQFDTYFKHEDVLVEEVLSRKLHPDEYLGAGQGMAVPTQVIKQADVIMMLNLFKEQYTQAVKTANWEYYEPRTEHGSSLSACAYALVAADIGKSDWAYKYFLRTAKLDLEAKYKVFVGTVFMGGSHPAANGGAWMTAVFGFAGIKAHSNKISIHPKLFSGWKSIRFSIHVRDNIFKLTVSHECVSIDALPANQSTQLFDVCRQEVLCSPGTSTIVDYIAINKQESELI